MTLKHLRSSTADKRPQASGMAEGQLAINTASGSPGLFFKDSASNLVKVGPVHVGSGAPNASPASGGTSGNSLGEQWLDTSGGTYVFKIWDGSAWRSEAGEFVNTTGDTMTGALGIIAGSASTPGLFFSGDANSGLYSPGADQVAISTGGSGRLFINSSGQVGVGVSPSASLEVNGEARFTRSGVASQYVGITGDGTDTRIVAEGASKNLTIKNNSTTSSAIIFDQAVASSYIFNQAGNERLRITSAGLVGVGTSSPSELLHIAGATNPAIVLQDTTNNTDARIKTNNNGDLVFEADYNGEAADTRISFEIDGSEKARFDSSGRLGVGTTSPGLTLDIKAATDGLLRVNNSNESSHGSADARIVAGGSFYQNPVIVGSSIKFNTYNGSSEGERVRITSAGLVGIGVSSPSSQLDIRGSATNFDGIRVINTDGGSGGATTAAIRLGITNSIGIRNTRIEAVEGSADSNSVHLDFYTNSANALDSETVKMRLTSGGALGIGTTSPSNALEVNGNIRTFTAAAGDVSITHSGLVSSITAAGSISLALGTNNTERARIDTSGRLLVGTSSSPTTGQGQYARIVAQGYNGDATGGGIISIQRGSAATGSGSAIGEICFGDNTGATFAKIGCDADATVSSASDLPGRLTFSTTADGASSPTERLRIQSSGDLRIANATTFYPQTDNAVSLGSGPAGPFRFSAVWAANGTIQTSDQRAKANVADAALGSEFIKSLRPVSYKWVEGGKYDTGERDEDGNFIYESVPGTRTHWGFIAQEVKQVVDAAGVDFGGWLLTDKDDPDSQQALRYDQFIAPLTKALQETMAELEVLKAEVAALKAQ